MSLVQHSYSTVPYYRKLFDDAGLNPAAIRSIDDLPLIPTTSKHALLAAGPDATTSSAFQSHQLICELTSGSSGIPFTVQFDTHAIHMRNAMFLRALTSIGYRPGRKLLLITSDRNKPSRSWLRWHYVSIADGTEQLIEAMKRVRPWGLYGCMTPLRQLATSLLDSSNGKSVPSPRFVASTAEPIDAVTRNLIARVFRSEIFDFYGMTEMGMVAWECPQHDGYHISEDNVLVEFIESEDSTEGHRLVMTNLELKATPFIRFETGDIATSKTTEPCGCGCNFSRLKRVEGRIVDCIRLRDGSQISPYRFTLAIEQIAGVAQYRVIQQDLDTVVVCVKAAGETFERTGATVKRAVSDVVGHNTQVQVRRVDSLDPPPGQKFRVVESCVNAEP